LPSHRDHETLFGADLVVDVLGRGVDIDLHLTLPLNTFSMSGSFMIPSLHLLDLARPPGPVEERFEWSIKPQTCVPALAGQVCTQLPLLPDGAVGPK
jgi:hypothetical protein